MVFDFEDITMALFEFNTGAIGSVNRFELKSFFIFA